MKNKEYNKRLSEAITWLRFPLIFLIIMLHCYSVQRLEGNHENYFKVLYTFYNWLGETGVPGFFFISGFLFFLSKKTYSQFIVKNKQYQLTHLLENGHDVVSHGKKVGHVSGRPHIKPVEEWCKTEVEKRIRKELS